MDLATTERPRDRVTSVGPRRAILEALREEPRTTREVADAVELHVNTARFHLRVLERGGLVRRDVEVPRGPGRPPIRWRAVAEEAERGYATLSALLAGFVAASGAAQEMEELGRTWGRSRGLPGSQNDPATQRVALMLGDLGFAPEPALGCDRRLMLRDCPFREVAATHPEVVCAIHLGLMRGAIEADGGTARVIGLAPFVEPTLCVVDLEDPGV
jgi:predicted ArsR family transcriptional regulator